MATTTKSASTLIASQSIPAGSTVTSSALDLRNSLSSGITARVTTATSPGAGPLLTVNVSKNGTSWSRLTQLEGPTDASTDSDFVVDLPDWASYAQVVVKNQDGGTVSITASADAHLITGVS